MQEIRKYIEDNKQRFLDELFELLRFPSVSADPKYKNDVLRTADFVADKLKEAVEQTNGPVMIVAGAGSGKTRVITCRVAHLITKGVDPFNILVLTFTNKAAKEMRERIMQAVGQEAKNIWMGTFHSVFAKILRVK